jgi:hypothetical protein
LFPAEFFLRQVYMCTAQAATDVVLFEVSFVRFWEVVELHRLEAAFSQQEQEPAEQASLAKDSTHHLVRKFSANLNKNSKMSMMMRLGSKRGMDLLEERLCILPDSWCAHWWALASVLCIGYIALTVPYFVAFRHANLAVAVCDGLLCAFFAADMYLRLQYFAVEEDGDLVRAQEEFSSIYLDSHLKWDLISVLPVALIALGTPPPSLHTHTHRLHNFRSATACLDSVVHILLRDNDCWLVLH